MIARYTLIVGPPGAGESTALGLIAMQWFRYPPDCVTESVEENDSLTARDLGAVQTQTAMRRPVAEPIGLEFRTGCCHRSPIQGTLQCLSFCNSKSDVKSINVGHFKNLRLVSE